MKQCMYLVDISIFSLNNATVRPTKIMNRADKNWAHFEYYLKNQNFQNTFLTKVGLLVKEKKMERFDQFSTLKNDFENQNFEMLEEVIHNFGKSDGDIIY